MYVLNTSRVPNVFAHKSVAKCTLKPQNFLVMTVLNILYAPDETPTSPPLLTPCRTDAAILYVPLPLLWTLRVPIRQYVRPSIRPV
jgi:hypothetical protein